jgi:hypothetical protein
MAEDVTARRQPLLNPVLRFMRDPRPESVVGGGKSSANIRHDRLADQRTRLAQQFRGMAKGAAKQPTFDGRAIVYAEMFEDSLAATWTPGDLLHPERGARLISPHRQGYLLEVDANRLEWFSHLVIAASTVRDLVDISRIRSIRFHGEEDIRRDRDLDKMWAEAPKHGEGRSFFAWLLPVSDGRAAEDVLQAIENLRSDAIEAPPPLLDGLDLDGGKGDSFARELRAIGDGDRLNGALRTYRKRRRASGIIVVRSRKGLDALIASGAVVRLEPVRPLVATSPGDGAEPDRPVPQSLAGLPIVGIVDGGLTAPSYKPAEAWRADPPLVANAAAVVQHGNRVTSLVVQGHDWNNNLKLAPLYCRFGTVQAIAKEGYQGADPESFVAYLDAVVGAQPETRVWNLSLNQPFDCDEENVSHLGHALTLLARKHDVLIVNSIGNQPGKWLQPPADCEAALTIGGRLHDDNGLPGEFCPVSLSGPGPSSLLKPDTAHFSRVRALGGAIVEGSSFATALTAPLAAHTMHRLRQPSPDLAKALLIHNATGSGFHQNVGFGSPSAEQLPWECQPGAVTFHWHHDLRPGAAYYWEVPIPPALIVDGKLRGAGKLTAILNPHPLVSEIAGPNYFSARLATAIQLPRGGKFHNLLGSMEREITEEEIARAIDHKWCPVRHHSRDFSSRGLSFDGTYLRVYARIYTRDLYLYGFKHMDEVEAMRATFVLTLASTDPDGDLYGEFREALGPYVEASVIETDIDLDIDGSP